MKAVKLKPLFFPTDDILVRPPEILCTQMTFNPDKLQNKTLSNLNQLKTILRGRKIKKSNSSQAKMLEDEKETVKKLTDWKRPASPNSPLTRKYTFKRTFTLTNINNSFSPEKIVPTDKPKPLRPNTINIFAGTIQAILSMDKLKKRLQEEESKNISTQNKEYEADLKNRIERLKRDIKGLKIFIHDNSEKLITLKNSFEEAKKQHEDKSNSLAMFEAQELLFKDKVKRSKPQDEAAYFIKKEKLRKMKQDLHKSFLETEEKFTNEINGQVRVLESAEHTRRMNKKQLLEYREEIIMLYCRMLKDGKDARSDGLRWIIKALWTMNEPVPISAFPRFLDDESAHFLLRVSELEIEQEMFSQQLGKIQQELKNSRPSSCTPNTLLLYSQVKKRLRQISQSSIGKSPIKLKAEKSSQEMKLNLSSSSYNEILSIKDKISKNQEEIATSINNEIKRVTDVYCLNPDGEEIGLFHIVRCLVGDKVREFNKYTRSSIVSRK